MKKAMLLFVSLLLSAGVLQAATFDFAAEAAGNERSAQGEVFTNGGVSLQTTGVSGVYGAVAYLDDVSGGLPGGLGVCSTGLSSGGECAVPSDDNVTNGEYLLLSFDQEVTITDVDFRNASHGTSFTGSIYVENFDLGLIQLFALAPTIDFSVLGKGYNFLVHLPLYLANDEFYINKLNAEVPVPAALFLFAPALLGFLGLRRKSSVAA